LNIPVLRNVSFAVAAGEMLALVGPSASGKTTLARSLIGTLRPTQGHVRLGGADAFDWMRSDLGPYIGYLPQDVELLPGSVRDNIARFSEAATDEDVVAAARLADCHEMILQLEGGYDMQLTDGGLQLSGGQRQRIGLARALIGTPRLVVLDEPNASLDAAGEDALFRALGQLKARGVTCIVVSHRTNLLRIADKVLVLDAGSVASFGTARDVVAKFARAAEKPARVEPPTASRAASAVNGMAAAVGEARA
jgi:ATP-binding cassette subfamily C exporter for protease/lipase